jgi:hypothetical protein
MMRLPKVRDKKAIRKELDIAWSKAIRSRGVCEKCGKQTDLQAHHIFSRRHNGTRWELGNGVCLCKRCHLFWAHKDTVDFARWIEGKIGKEKMDLLEYKAKSVNKFSKGELEIFLKAFAFGAGKWK